MCCWRAWRCVTARWCASAMPNGTTSSADRRCATGCRPGCCTSGSSFSAVPPSAVVTSPGRNLAGWPSRKQASGPVSPWRPRHGICSACRSPRTCCAMPRASWRRAGPAVRCRRPARAVPPTAPTAADGGADATAQQVAALAERVTELTEQLDPDPGAGWMRTQASLSRQLAQAHPPGGPGAVRGGQPRSRRRQRGESTPGPSPKRGTGRSGREAQRGRSPRLAPDRTHRRPAMTPERPAFFEGQILAAADLTSAVDYGRAASLPGTSATCTPGVSPKASS